ncbi:hypothetical protein MOPEL_003_01020 [Mobilicoccus pelagius NBRC 104925]|uniref:Glycosyltransferase subfamily 4-like N-terminal domain-containing protein n=1 Tax=Mobilicoccus pelagius NBRC 104925 TaxID=1089455 RepID=H5UMX0_9MICO|nr:hypothetical protein MOPEL_003_01020 [Mobilicoccus pelagius NBRC 104925]
MLMLVNNDIRHDTRVMKSALAVADGGAHVTVIGYGSEGYPEHVRLGDVEIYRVPLAWRYHHKAQDRRRRFENRTIIPDMTPSERRAVVRRSRLRTAEAAELGGRDREVRAKVAETGAKVRTRLGRLQQRLHGAEKDLRARALEWHDDRTEFASWRRSLPAIDDYEVAYSALVNSLEWDVIHAHDMHHMGTAARAVARRRAEGRQAWWIYDAHEYVAGLSLSPPRTPRIRAAYVDLEREYIGMAGAVITVTGALAEELQRAHHLPERPAVVYNSPVLDGDPGIREGLDVRADCGVAPDVPLLVYSGGITVARGVQTAIGALPQLPGVHLAVVCVPTTKTTRVEALRELTTALGVTDRVHFLEPVAPDDVSAYLASADVGTIPLVHYGSHEFALANKLFEYLHAGIPLLVSDCRAQAEFVTSHDVGEVHRAEDVDDFARAARRVLDRVPELRRHIADNPQMLAPYDWNRQAQSLREVYRSLVGADRLAEPAHSTDLSEVTEEPWWRDDRPAVLGIGASNLAGEGWGWGKAVERNVPGVRASVLGIDMGGPLTFPADEVVPFSVFRANPRWAAGFAERIEAEWTHALIEAGRPLVGRRYGRTFVKHADALRALGIRVGLLLHGHDVRSPEDTTRRTRFSPFTDPLEESTYQLGSRRAFLLQKAEGFLEAGHGPVFVSSPDLALDVPGAIWLPVAVDTNIWEAEPTSFDREVPVVLHVPTDTRLAGSEVADAVGRRLEAEGLIEYRRLENVLPTAMPGLVAEADVVLDQFRIGTYGLRAVEAMASGRIVLGHVVDEVRAQAPGCAIVEADPETLEDVLRGLLTDREAGRRAARAGVEFVREHHDGRLAAELLDEHLHLRR